MIFISILSCNDTVVMPLKEYCRSCDQLSNLLPVFIFFQNRQKAKKIFWPDRRRALSRWLLRSPLPPSGIIKSLILPKCHLLITQLQNTYFNPRVNSTFLLNFSIIRHCKTLTPLKKGWPSQQREGEEDDPWPRTNLLFWKCKREKLHC